MLLYNARVNDQGFTLVEALTAVIIISILSVIAVPSFLVMLNQNKANDALAQARGALQEAQREATRKNKSCTVNVPTGENPTMSSNCFITGNRTLNGINIKNFKTDNTEKSSAWKITFDFKGRTIDEESAGTMVLSVADTSTNKKCLVVSQGLGMIRTGKYKAPNCETSR